VFHSPQQSFRLCVSTLRSATEDGREETASSLRPPLADFGGIRSANGGVTLQPCLLDTPIVYLARDEIPAALRAFWNTYALLIYPDTQCFAERAPGFGRGGGPVYKTSDESRFIM
jgi:hypothetical protein